MRMPFDYPEDVDRTLFFVAGILFAMLFTGCSLNYYPPPNGTVLSKSSDTTCYITLDRHAIFDATGIWGTMLETSMSCQCPDSTKVGDTFTIQFTRP